MTSPGTGPEVASLNPHSHRHPLWVQLVHRISYTRMRGLQATPPKNVTRGGAPGCCENRRLDGTTQNRERQRAAVHTERPLAHARGSVRGVASPRLRGELGRMTFARFSTASAGSVRRNHRSHHRTAESVSPAAACAAGGGVDSAGNRRGGVVMAAPAGAAAND